MQAIITVTCYGLGCVFLFIIIVRFYLIYFLSVFLYLLLDLIQYYSVFDDSSHTLAFF